MFVSVVEVLPFAYIPPKVIKLSIAKRSLNGVLREPCLHTTKLSFGYKTTRMKAEEWGYPDDAVMYVTVESYRKKKLRQA